MKKKHSFKKQGLFKRLKLTSETVSLYDVIAVDKKTGEIATIGRVSSKSDAKRLKELYNNQFLSYYVLEDATALQEI